MGSSDSRIRGSHNSRQGHRLEHTKNDLHSNILRPWFHLTQPKNPYPSYSAHVAVAGPMVSVTYDDIVSGIFVLVSPLFIFFGSRFNRPALFIAGTSHHCLAFSCLSLVAREP